MTDSIGNRLRSLRIEHGMTQTVLAEELGVTKNTIWRLECKGDTPHVYVVMMYAEHFGVSTDWILFGKEHEA